MDYNQYQGDPYGQNRPPDQYVPENGNQYNTPANTVSGRSVNSFAVASLIMGVCSIVLCCLGIFSIPMGGLGILFAILSRRKRKGMPGMGIAGMCTSILGLLFGLFFLIYVVFISAIMEDPDSRHMLDPLYEQTYGMDFEEFMEYYGYYFDN